MKRPLAAVGFMYLFAQIAAVFGGGTVSFVLFFVTAAALLLYLLFFRRRSVIIVTLALSALASLALHSAYELIYVRPVLTLEGSEAAITARVTEQPRGKDGYYWCFVTTQSVKVKGAPQEIKLRLSSRDPIEANVDDIISCRVTVMRSERSLSSVQSARAKGAVAAASVVGDYPLTVSAGSRSLYGRIAGLRQRLTDRIRSIYGGELSGLLTGVLLGDTSYIDDRTLRMFRICGLSHYLAVSGLHLSVLSFWLGRLLTMCRLPLKALAAIMPVFIVFFMALTGFSASVERAGIMLIIYYAARAFSREGDSLNSLGAAVLVICLLRPYAAADAGFLMSVSCTAGLITLVPPLRRLAARRVKDRVGVRYRKYAIKAAEAAITPLVASLAILPVSSLYFGELSLISVPCNMLCVYPATYFLLFGAASVILSPIPLVGGALCFMFMLPARLCAAVLLALARVCSMPSRAVVNVQFDCLPALFAACAVLFGAARFLTAGKRSNYRSYASSRSIASSRSGTLSRHGTLILCAALSAVMIVSGISAELIRCRSGDEIRIFNVGGGIACCARSGGKGLLFGAGGDRFLAREMTGELDRMKLSSIDNMVLPEDSEIYMSYADEAAAMLRPEWVWMPEDGTYSARVLSECARYGGKRGDISEDIQWNGGGTGFGLFTDSSGARWYRLFAGGVEALIAPEGGDASLLPEEMRSPDAVIVLSDRMISPSLLGNALFVVCGESKQAALAAVSLKARGIANVCAAADSDMLSITAVNDGIRLEEMKSDARY